MKLTDCGKLPSLLRNDVEHGTKKLIVLVRGVNVVKLIVFVIKPAARKLECLSMIIVFGCSSNAGK